MVPGYVELSTLRQAQVVDAERRLVGFLFGPPIGDVFEISDHVGQGSINDLSLPQGGLFYPSYQ